MEVSVWLFMKETLMMIPMTKSMSTSEAKNLMRKIVLTSQLKTQSLLTTEIFVFEKINKDLESQFHAPSI